MRRSERKQADPDLGILIARVLFGLQREMSRELRTDKSGPGPRHGAVLAYLDEEGSRATDLAAQSGQHKQVIGTLVDDLVAMGYVERRPDPSDRRAKLVVPTERGLDMMRRSDEVVAAIERRYAQAVGEEEFAVFKATLRKLAELQVTSDATT
ncbi:MarR family winged helix-turn-helix transcriptional regulator [Thermoactinospora rubra]|uniref:MarR family winged helix-turn-helix transcriptional regulator n=1 Tax=Thermoactinospora rubra TaxID=1088767 RepID=UPI000A0FEEA0|nr:MarR family winged helix-turn-helix transcriptional regulator [Thermoactinospora rubra]